MKQIFKSLIIISLFLINTNAEVNVTEGIRNLNEKNSQRFNSDEFWEKYEEVRKFDKSKWEKMWQIEYKRTYKDSVNRAKKKNRPIDEKREDLFAKYSASCFVKDRFIAEKNSHIIETSPQRKEMEEYREMLRQQCFKARDDLNNYIEETNPNSPFRFF
ncbi:hypothetical protein HpCK38_17390 [Helicobacter pylori]